MPHFSRCRCSRAMESTLATVARVILIALACFFATRPVSAGLVDLAETQTLEPGEILDPRQMSRRLAAGEDVLTAKERQLIERPDRERPQHPITLPLFGRPLAIGGRYTLVVRSETDKLLDFDFEDFDNRDIDGDGDFDEIEDSARGNVPADDQLRANQALQVDLFYPITENVSVYLESVAAYRKLVWADDADNTSEWLFQRGESWLYLGDLLGTSVSLQAGRQRFADEREWWWDEDLDAVRLHYDLETVHAEVAVAEQLFGLEYGESIQPDDEDILQILGSVKWEWAHKQQLGLYALHRHDHSSVQEPFVPDPTLLCVPENLIPPGIPEEFREFFRRGCPDPVSFEDDSDPDLTWFGASAAGNWKLGRAGMLDYWLDVAGVKGDETFTDYSGPNDARTVRSVNRHNVSGWGIDARTTWQSKLPGRLTATLGYAFGSGKRKMLEEEDRGFRQTGLEDNSHKFRGVQSFRSYGELLDPELSNLQILTAALGVRFFAKSSLDIVYHHYRQAEAAPFLRDVGFKRDPDGRHRSIGQEIDLVIGIKEFRIFELKLVGAIFRAGAAFGRDDGKLSYLGSMRARLNF